MASGTSNAINKVPAFASDIFLAHIFSLGVCAGDASTFVQKWAISALFSFANVAHLTIWDGFLGFGLAYLPDSP